MLGRLRRDLTSTFSAGGWLPIIHRAAPGTVALTYDDGPTPETTPALLALLRDHDARATFFLSGRRAAAHPGLVAAIVAEGHGIFAHGLDHRRLDGMPPAAALREITETEAILACHRPTPSPYLIRLPYGAGHRDARIHALLRSWRADCQIVHWRHDFRDFRLAEGCETLPELDRRCHEAVTRALATGNLPGSVVLLHEHPFGAEGALVPEIAPRLLEALLRGMAGNGLRASGMVPRDRHGLFARCVRTVPIE